MARTRVLVVLVLVALVMPTLVAAPQEAGSGENTVLQLRRPVVVSAAAVAQTEEGLVGSVATISISAARNGSGHIFMDTVPLTQVDMQGSARLAVQVAGSVTGVDTSTVDMFFVVRSGSQIIGGPSAGAIMTVGTIAAIMGWDVDSSVMMTGTINPDGSVGPVGGVPEKAAAAAQQGATLFLYPEGQEAARAARGIVDMGSYCARELGITCQAVPDVESAIPFVTGHAFERPELTGNVTDAEYQRLMRPLAAELHGMAQDQFGNATADLANATNVPPVVQRELERSRSRSADALDAAGRALRSEQYYTTASKSFQSAIESRFITSVIGYVQAKNPDAYALDVMESTTLRAREVGVLARSAQGVDAARLQAVGAAQVRASEAESRVEEARALLGNASTVPSVVEAFYQAAYAFERAETAEWWLRIGEAFTGESVMLNPADLERAARESISTAEASLTYAEVILQESGAVALDVPSARETLARARADFEEGYFAAATFQAVEAEVQGNLALELLGYEGQVPASKIENARKAAERAILISRDHGIEPLLAVPYYEFAGSFEDGTQQLLFYSLARMIARFTEFLADPAPAARTSRFVGDVDTTVGPLVPFNHLAAFFAMGLALGAVVSVMVLVPARELGESAAPRPRPRAPEPDPAAAAIGRASGAAGVSARETDERARESR